MAADRQRNERGHGMRVIDRENRLSLGELKEMAAAMFGDLVKAVVDVKRETMMVDAELHADGEALLLEQGSDQADLWGINLYPALRGDDFIEFDSLINLRPSCGNRSRGVEDPATRRRIRTIVNDLVVK
jgi:hypothetical protein